MRLVVRTSHRLLFANVVLGENVFQKGENGFLGGRESIFRRDCDTDSW
ncbi:hypothetical protein RSSM_06378 [Rhodopirellula sallentina SM41]|uniref:Uncharacterized protein n=1 Tax=Rhodopirellula sallentina SM41 TaxID=1263870 RepID=M5TSL3_9BACT|nr:hypothetical protein RSSM_06378 [Rhodopirellula sallentina SM41]